MKKEKQEIATNTSSGAEKVETIEKQKKTTVKTQSPTASGEAALGKGEAKTGSKADKEKQAAKARVEAAQKKKEEKAARAKKRKEAREKRIAELKARIEKRKVAKKALIEKRAAERKARAEKRAAAKEERLREKAHKKANRNQTVSRKKAEKNQSRSKRRESREKGYGGWIAAVVSLGVVTLALATTVTVGAVEMRRSSMAMMSAYRGTMYELTGVIDNVDEDLDRVRISASPTQQSRILTDLLVQTRLAEADLEKLPIRAESDRNMTSCLNRTAAASERMLSKLANGERLSEKDYEELERLYKTNHAIREELDKIVGTMTDKDMMAYMKKGEGGFKDALERIENGTLEENRMTFGGKKEDSAGAGTELKEKKPPKSGKHIDTRKAEELCKKYFAKYNIEEYQCIGETVSQGMLAYNVQGYDDNGTQLFAEISQRDGALIRFDYYEDCNAETFDLQNAERIAEEFLEYLGYDDLEVVRFRANGTTTDFTFVYEDDDVLYYPDEIHVKVCRTRGTVSGFDASKYLQNHRGRDEVNVKISLADARDLLHDKLAVESVRLAVVRTARGERPAYEFLCSYEKERYFVYIDAENGAEISIINVKSVL